MGPDERRETEKKEKQLQDLEIQREQIRQAQQVTLLEQTRLMIVTAQLAEQVILARLVYI